MVVNRLALPASRAWPETRPAALLRATLRLVRTHAFRLAALYFLVFAASVLSVLFFVYWTSADFVERQTETTLDAEITGLAEQYAQRGLSGLVQIVAARSAGDPGDAMLYLVTDPDGHPLAGNIAGWPLGVPARSGWLSFTVEARSHGHVATHPARGSLIIIPGGYRLLVGRDISDAAAFRNRVKLTLLWSGLVALGVGLLGGAAMSRNLLRRVELVNRTSERVMAGNLSDRVPLDGTSDEFDLLAANLNRMLDQIERLMTAMREVTDDVAHDLKTPLSRLRARLELALIGPADAGAQSEAIRAAIDEADRMLATFNALLRIAEAEAGAGLDRTEALDLGEVARSAAEFYEPVAEEKGFTLSLAIEPGVQIRGDRHLLSQALANLLDNAAKYADGGELAVRVFRSEERAALEVADRGPGIPEPDREVVFNRFVRLEPSRSTPGNGLGLSLVRAVAHRHHGTVALLDNRPGLCVRLEFPLLAA
ncbi:MAG TPA: HAMP domain-containing sensor histidine kinase [Stellaceae bacterium]|jgi:signal transduction histidine kinase|nr:HAMP domain-containing sensor histidine kinase [Stellaceae bacterium]